MRSWQPARTDQAPRRNDRDPPDARRDLREIVAHTAAQFGSEQVLRVRATVESSFGRLAEMPESGRRRPELDPPDRSFRYLPFLRRFVIAYEVQPGMIVIVRVLHGARGIETELREEGAGSGE